MGSQSQRTKTRPRPAPVLRPAGAAAIVACLVGAGAGDARASVPDHYGFGSRSAAMAGAVTAAASDFSAVYYNPAGLTEAPAVEVSVGYMYNWQNLYINDVDNEVAPVRGIVAGLVAPGKILDIPFAFGVSLHLPDHGVSFIYARRQGVPRWELYDNRSQLLYLAAVLAIRPFDWLEVGGGIAFLSATRGSFGIRGKADILSPYESKLEHEVDADLTAVRFPQLGARFVLGGWGAFGVTYRGESKLDLELDALLEGVVNFAGIDVPLVYELEARTIAAFTPHQLAFGLSFEGVEQLELNFDLTWVNWSGYESPTASIYARLDAQPPPGTPVELPGEPAPTKIVPPEFEDRWVPRIGAEYRIPATGEVRRPREGEEPEIAVEIPVRAGYVYEASPVPDQTGISNLVDADRHTWTLGLGLTVAQLGEEFIGALHLDVHGAYTLLPERVTEKVNAADFVGDYRASGEVFALGTTLRIAF